MKKNFYILFPLVAMLVCASCSGEEGGKSAIEAPNFTVEETIVSDGLKDFTINFFQAACDGTDDENIVVSPFSAAMLVSMLGNVSDEPVSSRICAALGCEDINSVNEVSKKYMGWLPYADSKVKLSLANSFWYSKDTALNPILSKISQENYHADIAACNFSEPEKVKAQINDWALYKTSGMISNAIDNLSANTNFLFLNALYFKGDWSKPFNKSRTNKSYFNGTKSLKQRIDMMHITEKYRYYETDDAKIVYMPFGNGNFNAVFILPAETVYIEDFIKSEEFKQLAASENKAENIEVVLSLPKFKIEPNVKTDLLEPFAKLGINGLRENIKLTEEVGETMFDAYQKTTIEFNEKGAEAASVSVGSNASIAPEIERVEMTIDRPFVFMITEQTNNLCLFAGKVTNLAQY